MATKDITDVQACLAVLRNMRGADPIGSDEILAAITGQPLKVCWRALERAVDRGFVEYGVSLRFGFLTPKGEQLLRNAGELSE